MNKRNLAFITMIAAGVFLSFAANSKKGSGNWGSSNTSFPDRWNERFVVDTPNGSTSITVNNSSTTPSSTAADASYGSGTMTCRDSVAKVSTDDAGGAGVSSLAIPELKHTITASYACTSFSPQLYIGGMPVNSGTVDFKCSNGSLRVIASNCSAPPPPPPPTTPTEPTAPAPTTPTTPTAPAANPNGCPIGNGYLSSNCGCCADATTTYANTRAGGGKDGNQCKRTNTNFKTCTNGRYWIQNTGACSTVKPNAC